MTFTRVKLASVAAFDIYSKLLKLSKTIVRDLIKHLPKMHSNMSKSLRKGTQLNIQALQLILSQPSAFQQRRITYVLVIPGCQFRTSGVN